MDHSEPALEVDPAIVRACSTFLAQARALVRVDGLSVVLLDRDQVTSRVVFFWEAPDQPDSRREPAGGLPSSPDGKQCRSTFISLEGNGDVIGAVLIRGEASGDHESMEVGLLYKPAERLAALLENILLQDLLDRSARERAALERISELATSKGPMDRVYELFADEVKKLLEYQRLTILLLAREDGLLSSVFQADPRTSTVPLATQSNLTNHLRGVGGEGVTSRSECRIIDDLQECLEQDWPEQLGDPHLRSAIVVPVVYGRETVGVVTLEHPLPNAYNSTDEHLLSRVAAALGPPMGNETLHDRMTERSQKAAATNEITRILESGRLLDDVIDRFAVAASQLVEFDRITLAWLDPSGCDILTLQFPPTKTVSRVGLEEEAVTNIRTRLQSGQECIGTLTLWRQNAVPFSIRDQALLDGLGAQLFFAVQYDRLSRLSRRQAYQLGQLLRATQPVDQSPEPSGVSGVMVDQAARMLDAPFAALYLCHDGRIAPARGARVPEAPTEFLDPLAPELVAMVENCLRTGERECLEVTASNPSPIKGADAQGWKTPGYLGVPLPGKVGPIGVLALGRRADSPWLPAEVDLLQAIGDELGEMLSASVPVQDFGGPERIRSSDSLRRDLLVNAAHALRTPLSSIKGYSSTLLQSDVEWPPELHQEFIETINREADQLGLAIIDLLGTTESESGGIHLDKSQVTVDSLLHRVKPQMADQGQARPVLIECAPNLPPALVDQTRIVQVITYLCRCIELIGHPDSAIRVRALMEDDWPQIFVSSRFGSDIDTDNERQVAKAEALETPDLLLRWVDEDVILKVCSTLLAAHGVELRKVGSGEEETESFGFELPTPLSPRLGGGPNSRS